MDEACHDAHRRQIAVHRAAAKRPRAPLVQVPHPFGDERAGAEATWTVDRVTELRWQVEQLREGIVWAVVNDPAKVTAIARERRDTLADLEQVERKTIAATGGDAVGTFLEPPLSLVPAKPLAPGA